VHKSERAEYVSTARDWADTIQGGIVLDAEGGRRVAAMLRTGAAAVDGYGSELEKWDEWEESMYQLALKLGFTGAGGGKRDAILRVFWWVHDNRKPVDSSTN